MLNWLEAMKQNECGTKQKRKGTFHSTVTPLTYLICGRSAIRPNGRTNGRSAERLSAVRPYGYMAERPDRRPAIYGRTRDYNLRKAIMLS